jgi:competence protein ComEA
MRLLHWFQERFGFTRTELITVLVLSATFLAGAALKLWMPRVSAQRVSQSFSYAALDSQFIALSKPRADSAAAPHKTEGRKPKGQPASHAVDPNSATAAELQLLPGIGPAIAERIVAYRKEHGKFTSIDALGEVKGIGPRILERIRPYLSLQR